MKHKFILVLLSLILPNTSYAATWQIGDEFWYGRSNDGNIYFSELGLSLLSDLRGNELYEVEFGIKFSHDSRKAISGALNFKDPRLGGYLLKSRLVEELEPDKYGHPRFLFGDLQGPLSSNMESTLLLKVSLNWHSGDFYSFPEPYIEHLGRVFVSEVPIPASLPLLSTALLFLRIRRRRKT